MTIDRQLMDAMQWRRDDGMLAIRTRDGAVHGYPAPAELNAFSQRIDFAEFTVGKRELSIATDRGDLIQLDVGTHRNPSPRRNRLVVYLDQNHVSSLSKALRAPHRLRNEEEWKAALDLIRWAGTGKIIVPFSAAHMAETGAWPNKEARYHLATTILSVSRGWQLRDPLQQRHDELVSLLTESVDRETAVPDAVTLAPNAALASRIQPSQARDTNIDANPTIRHLYQSMVWLNVSVAVMLDEDSIPKTPADDWVKRVQRFTDWLQAEPERTKANRRKAAAAFMFSDESTELARAAADAGLAPSELSGWSRDSWLLDDRGRPGVSVFRSAMIDKIVSGHEWEPNDLVDLMYLSTAVGYCDFVAGDRRTAALLRQQTRRLGYGAELHSDLVGLVASVAKRLEGARDQGERSRTSPKTSPAGLPRVRNRNSE